MDDISQEIRNLWDEHDFKEACSAVADLYEAIPETWIGDGSADGETKDGTPRFCAVMGVAHASGLGWLKSADMLLPFMDPRDRRPHETSNRSRKDAIAMLRKAAEATK